MSATYPVHYQVERPLRFTRVQLLIRVVAFLALGMIGLSFGAVFVCAYLALPVLAAVRISGRGAEAYVRDDRPHVLRGVRWFAAVSAWMGLITDQLPSKTPEETVTIEIESTERVSPTPSSAVWRVVMGLPSAVALGGLGFIGGFVWVWAALSILVVQRVGAGAFHFLVGLQRWSIRLLAYQASLVDDYPPFAFSDLQAPTMPAAHLTR